MKGYREAVFVLAYSKTGKGIQYLLFKRKLHWRGWEFPKGGIKESESKEHAAKRELKEETGLVPLKIKNFNYSGKYNYKNFIPGRKGFRGQTFHLYAAEVKKRKVKLSYEHSGYKWVGFSEALKMLKWSDQKKSLKMVNSWLENEI